MQRRPQNHPGKIGSVAGHTLCSLWTLVVKTIRVDTGGKVTQRTLRIYPLCILYMSWRLYVPVCLLSIQADRSHMQRSMKLRTSLLDTVCML